MSWVLCSPRREIGTVEDVMSRNGDVTGEVAVSINRFMQMCFASIDPSKLGSDGSVCMVESGAAPTPSRRSWPMASGLH